MLKVGIVGFGFMGQTHYKCWKALEGAQVTAICDVNPNIEEDTKRAVGNIGDTDEAVDFSNIQLFTDLDQMLNTAELDAVSITLPTCLHADCSIKALAAGVHVFCEKPMALNVEDCERMIAEAKRSGKIMQIGHCVRFWPEYAKAKEIIDSGEYGKVIAAMFQRLGSAPTWSIDNWFLDEERSGGMALDLHIHDTDFVQYLFGIPNAVSSFAAKDAKEGLKHIVSQYLYDDNKVVTAEGGWAMTPTFGFEMSFNIVMEKATLVYDLTREPMFKLCPAEGQVITPEIQKGDGWLLEIEHFAKAISGEKVGEITTLEQSRDSVKIVAAEKESARSGEKVVIK
ncbi:MAG: Gfo/Idh/MocA family oxidoreductase [Sedimentisphaerales bacterium]|nr:Gfo/Idh/MocA family oxidoreductase [Sedimentisphaerales bacterium]